jgi:thioredoxin reductase (NADPH)
LIIQGLEPGGQLTLTTLVENYLGFAEGIDGSALMLEMRKQAERFGTEFVDDNVTSIFEDAGTTSLIASPSMKRCTDSVSSPLPVGICAFATTDIPLPP